MILILFLVLLNFCLFWEEDKKPENTDIKAGLVYILKVNSKKPWAQIRLYRIYISKQNVMKIKLKTKQTTTKESKAKAKANKQSKVQ